MVSVHDTESVYSVLSSSMSDVTRADVTELRKYMNPSEQVKIIIAAIMYALDPSISKIHADKLWTNFIKIMAKNT